MLLTLSLFLIHEPFRKINHIRTTQPAPVVADIHIRGEIPQATVWPLLVVMLTPGFNDLTNVYVLICWSVSEVELAIGSFRAV